MINKTIKRHKLFYLHWHSLKARIRIGFLFWTTDIRTRPLAILKKSHTCENYMGGVEGSGGGGYATPPEVLVFLYILKKEF